MSGPGQGFTGPMIGGIPRQNVMMGQMLQGQSPSGVMPMMQPNTQFPLNTGMDHPMHQMGQAPMAPMAPVLGQQFPQGGNPNPFQKPVNPFAGAMPRGQGVPVGPVAPRFQPSGNPNPNPDPRLAFGGIK